MAPQLKGERERENYIFTSNVNWALSCAKLTLMALLNYPLSYLEKKMKKKKAVYLINYKLVQFIP